MTRRKFATTSAAAALAASAVTMTGCTSSQIVADIESGLNIIAGFLPTLGGLTGVPAALVTTVDTYVAAANAAFGQASTILASGVPIGEEVAEIAAAFAAVVAPIVPPPFSVIASIVSSVAAAVAKFLTGLPAPSVAAKMGAKAKAATVSVSTSDVARLRKLRVKADANGVALAALR